MIKIGKLAETLEFIRSNPKQFGISPDMIDDFPVNIIDLGYNDREVMRIGVDHSEFKVITVDMCNKE